MTHPIPLALLLAAALAPYWFAPAVREARALYACDAACVDQIRGCEMTGVEEIAAERQRQIEVEGWTAKHDDCQAGGDIARAAAAYALSSTEYPKMRGHKPPAFWPWAAEWWKPTTRRRDLIKAGALIAAEIDRLDRLDRIDAPRVEIRSEDAK